jgi:hypothetical protein
MSEEVLGANKEQQKSQRQFLTEKHWKEDLDFDNDEFRKQTGVDVYKIEDYHARMGLLVFWKKSSAEMRQRIVGFSKAYGENGISAFVSLSENENGVEKILEIGEAAKFENEDVAREAFFKLTEISHFLEDISASHGGSLVGSEDFERFQKGQKINMQNRFVALDSTKILIQKVYEIINRYHSLIRSEKEAPDSKIMENFLSDLERSEAETDVLFALFKTAKERGVSIPFEDVRDMKMEIKEVDSLLPKEKEEMIAMAKVNWEQVSALKDTVVGGLKTDLESEKKQKIHILRYKGKIVSFIRFEETERGTIYAGSFNVKAELRGVDVGNEMIKRTLIRVSQEKNSEGKYSVIEGTVSPHLSIGTNYIEDVGFVIAGMIINYKGTGEPLFVLELNRDTNNNYKMRNEGKSEMEKIGLVQLVSQYKEYTNVKELISNETVILRYDMKADWNKMTEELQKFLIAKDDNRNDLLGQVSGSKYKITRYLRSKNKREKDGDMRYFVLEKIA